MSLVEFVKRYSSDDRCHLDLNQSQCVVVLALFVFSLARNNVHASSELNSFFFRLKFFLAVLSSYYRSSDKRESRSSWPSVWSHHRSARFPRRGHLRTRLPNTNPWRWWSTILIPDHSVLESIIRTTTKITQIFSIESNVLSRSWSYLVSFDSYWTVNSEDLYSNKHIFSDFADSDAIG